MPKAIVRGVKTFDVDIAQEFRELHRQNAELREDLNKQNAEMREGLTKLNESFKQEIQTLKDSISVQTNAFERELGKLNDNMSKVLDQIADHESRLTNLEQKSKEQEIEDGVWYKVKRASFNFAVWAFWAVVVVSAAYGVKPALKVFNLFAN
jgi:predicted nuclease with TOPRIM domain